MPVPIPRRENVHPVVKPPFSKIDFHVLLQTIPVLPNGPPPAFSTRQEWIDSLPSWRREKTRYCDDEPEAWQSDPPPQIPLQQGYGCPSEYQWTAQMDSHIGTRDSTLLLQLLMNTAQKRHSREASADSLKATIRSPRDETRITESQLSSHVYQPGNLQGYPQAQLNDTSADVPAESRECKPAQYVSPSAQHIYTPAAGPAYKQISEALATWAADYLWKVTTQGMSLPASFLGTANFVDKCPTEPLPCLAESIHSVLLSTLLQPSVVMLALQYVSRLPVYLGLCASLPQGNIAQFRKLYIGQDFSETGVLDLTAATYASFKVFVAAIVLSNKMLDDHVFTLRTWYEVSGIPLEILNQLEWLSLGILSHELSLSPEVWGNWVQQLSSYHTSLTPFPLPIGSRKGTPHAIIRSLIDDLQCACGPPIVNGLLFDPVFLGIDDRIVEKDRERRATGEYDPLDFDLDEDGPLREEYIPKRRSSMQSQEANGLDRGLPPPSQWSPGVADSPVNVPIKATYQAVQRTPHFASPGSWASITPSTSQDTSVSLYNIQDVVEATASHLKPRVPPSYLAHNGPYHTISLRQNSPSNPTMYLPPGVSTFEHYFPSWIRI